MNTLTVLLLSILSLNFVLASRSLSQSHLERSATYCNAEDEDSDVGCLFFNRKKHINPYLSYILDKKQDFADIDGIKGYISIKGFAKLPAFKENFSPLEKEVGYDIEAYYNLKTIRKSRKGFFHRGINLHRFPGEFVALYESLLVDKVEIPKISLSYQKNKIEDPIFGSLTSPILNNKNQLQKKLYKEFLCKETILANNFATFKDIVYVHLGDFCHKALVILYSKDNNKTVTETETYLIENTDGVSLDSLFNHYLLDI